MVEIKRRFALFRYPAVLQAPKAPKHFSQWESYSWARLQARTMPGQSICVVRRCGASPESGPQKSTGHNRYGLSLARGIDGQAERRALGRYPQFLPALPHKGLDGGFLCVHMGASGEVPHSVHVAGVGPLRQEYLPFVSLCLEDH